MSSMLSRFIRRQGKNLKKHGPKMLGVASMLGFNPLGLLGKGMQTLGGKEMLGSIGANFLGITDPSKQAGGGLGLGLNILGGLGQMNAGYDADYLRMMNRQLGPLTDAHRNLTQLSQDYMDVNSPLHQQMRNAIRGNELTAMSDVMDRAVNQATGTYGDAVQGNVNMNALSDAISRGLGQYSGQTAKHFQTGVNLAGSAGTLGANLSQQRLQNLMLAQQKAQQPWKYAAETGFGLMSRALS